MRPLVLSIFDDVYIRGVALSELTNTETESNEHGELILNQYTKSSSNFFRFIVKNSFDFSVRLLFFLSIESNFKNKQTLIK